MNKDQAQGNYEQIKGKLRSAWGRLTDDEIALYKGKQEEFYGALQEKYGIARQEAEKRVKELEDACNNAADAA